MFLHTLLWGETLFAADVTSIYGCLLHHLVYWGEPKWAPHRRFCCGICLLYYIYRTSCRKSHPALILRVLASFLIQQLFNNYSPTTQREDTNCRTSLMATARTETTRGPTYSTTRVIWASPWQKGFIRQCHCLRCHYSPLTVEVDEHVTCWQWSCACNCSMFCTCTRSGSPHNVLHSTSIIYE